MRENIPCVRTMCPERLWQGLVGKCQVFYFEVTPMSEERKGAFGERSFFFRIYLALDFSHTTIKHGADKEAVER